MTTSVEEFPKILVTGGAGYVGSVLTARLLAAGHSVTVYDAGYFGVESLPLGNSSLTLELGDIRDTDRLAQALRGHDAVVHLACISNDPSFELDEELSRSINFECFEPMVMAARDAGIRRFIYASTSSVYGVSDAPEVTEEHPLVPLTLYNDFKGRCEPLLFRHQNEDFTCVTVRPATVCGYSPRCRLDLSVNILTNHAVNLGKIVVLGGQQLRPNIHIEDMVDVYELLLSVPDELVAGETFNAGYQNRSIEDLALIVKEVVEEEYPGRRAVEVEWQESNDPRSYRINSEKIRRVLGFEPKRTIEDAVHDLCRAFAAGLLPDSFDDDRYYNVRTMKQREAR